MEIRRFGHEDVSEAVELSNAAGWNQIEPDWHRLVSVEPDGCIGAWIDGRLVGTTTFVTYEHELAWIGMVLVRPEARGQGIGTKLVRAAMDILKESPVQVIGLDATDAGRPLYEREGFAEVAPIIRWTGSIRAVGNPDNTRVVTADLLDAVAQYDHTVVGVDRRSLVAELTRADEGAGFAVLSEEERVEGYVLMRPGRTAWQVGPLVADHKAVQKDLLGAAGEYLAGKEVVVDAINRYGFHSLLRSVGLHPNRHLTRMTAPQATRDCLIGSSILAAAGFEWG